MFQTKVVEKIRTLYYVQKNFFFFFFEFRTVHEIIGKMLQSRSGHITVRCMRNACGMSRYANTYSGYVMFCFSTATVVARTRINVVF